MNTFLAISLVGSCAGYWLIDFLPHPFWGLLVQLSVQFLIFTIIVARTHANTGMRPVMILTVAVITRVILLFSPPILENDYWRYLWDGRVLAHGINPYFYAPSSPALDHLNTFYRNHIGWPQFSTIYPPVAQILFAFAHLVSSDSLLTIKIIFALFDLGTGWILYLWLLRLGKNPAWSILYLLNPLVLKEIANSAHLDSVPVFFTTLSLFLMTALNKARLAWVALALGICSKLYPFVLIPLFVRVDSRWRKHLIFLFIIVGGLYLPFLGAGTNVFGGTGAYATYWIFNAGIFQLVTMFFKLILGDLTIFSENIFLAEAVKNDFPAKIFLGVIFLGLLAWQAKQLRAKGDLPKAAFWTLGLLLLISPVVDAWYVLWVLPLACLYANVPWIAFSFLVVASYSWFFSKEMAPYFRFGEYSLFFLLGYLHFKSRCLCNKSPCFCT